MSTGRRPRADMGRYMEEVRRYERISRDEERALGEAARRGDSSARERLVTANLRLVVKIAHTFKRYGVPFEDLVAEGNVGLMTAADKFDPGNGAKFSVYAAWWIKNRMRAAVLSQPGEIRIPGQLKQRQAAVAKARMALGPSGATDDAVCRSLGITAGQLRDSDAHEFEIYSMDEKVDPEGDATFGDILADEPADDGGRGSRIDAVRRALGGLPGRDRLIMELRFGIGRAEASVPAIAREVGLDVKKTQERIREILSRMRPLLEQP